MQWLAQVAGVTERIQLGAQYVKEHFFTVVDHDVLVMPKYGSMTQAEAESSASLFASQVIPRLS